jgi:hypothetical protein
MLRRAEVAIGCAAALLNADWRADCRMCAILLASVVLYGMRLHTAPPELATGWPLRLGGARAYKKPLALGRKNGSGPQPRWCWRPRSIGGVVGAARAARRVGTWPSRRTRTAGVRSRSAVSSSGTSRARALLCLVATDSAAPN